jgi:hypothetical protein
MEAENFDLEGIMRDRRHAVAESIHQISVPELKILAETLFPDVTHPWYEKYLEFIEQNQGEVFYHGTTEERIHLLYCHSKERGIWFIIGVGIGILQENELKTMREIVETGK